MDQLQYTESKSESNYITKIVSFFTQQTTAINQIKQH